MYKMAFFKNNKEVKINLEEISYFKNDLIIQKETEDHIIILDFKNKRCSLKIDEVKMDIPILSMNFKQENNQDIFTYTLVTEPEIKNTIIILQKR